MWPVKTKRSRGENVVVEVCTHSTLPDPGSAPSLPSRWPLLSPQAPEQREDPNNGCLWELNGFAGQALTPSLFDRNTTRTCSAEERLTPPPPCKKVMNTAQALNRQEKKNHKQRNRHRRQIKSNGVRKEPVLCPVSPLFITDWAYTIQASAQFRARNLTSQSSCRLYLCLQALLIFHIYFISSPGSLLMVSSRGERVLVHYLLGKSDGQLPQEPVFINKRSVYGICPSIGLWPRDLHLSQSNRLKIHLQIISSLCLPFQEHLGSDEM